MNFSRSDQMPRSMLRPVTAGLGMLILLAAYLAPWLTTLSAGTSFSAFDLAEWASLHPAAWAIGEAPLTSFLLRSLLAGVALVLILAEGASIIRWPAAGLLAIACLPPISNIAQWSNPNYAQQVGLAVAIAVMMALGFFMPQWVKAARLWLVRGTALYLAAAALLASIQAANLMGGFGIAAQIGIGPYLAFVGSGILVVATLRGQPTGSTQGRPQPM